MLPRLVLAGMVVSVIAGCSVGQKGSDSAPIPSGVDLVQVKLVERDATQPGLTLVPVWTTNLNDSSQSQRNRPRD